MMKENKIKVILCSIFAVISIFSLTMLNFSSSSLTEEVIKSLNESVKSISKYTNKYKIPTKGNVEIKANYKGAHGESFPKDFKYKYALEDNILYFSDSEGYTKLELDANLLSFINNFRNSNNSDVFVIEKENDEGAMINATLDIASINKFFNSDFKKAEMTINKKNIFSKEIKDITLTIDDYIITIDDKKYRLMYNDQIVDISIVNNGYSLSVNKNVKMNVMFEKNVDNYNAIVDNFVYSLNISDNSVKFAANTRASIYNSIEVTFTGNDDVVVEKKKELSVTDNPITRYFAEKE